MRGDSWVVDWDLWTTHVLSRLGTGPSMSSFCVDGMGVRLTTVRLTSKFRSATGPLTVSGKDTRVTPWTVRRLSRRTFLFGCYSTRRLVCVDVEDHYLSNYGPLPRWVAPSPHPWVRGPPLDWVVCSSRSPTRRSHVCSRRTPVRLLPVSVSEK